MKPSPDTMRHTSRGTRRALVATDRDDVYAFLGRLGLYFVIGAIAWATFIYNGIAVPDSFTTILATIAGK